MSEIKEMANNWYAYNELIQNYFIKFPGKFHITSKSYEIYWLYLQCSVFSVSPSSHGTLCSMSTNLIESFIASWMFFHLPLSNLSGISFAVEVAKKIKWKLFCNLHFIYEYKAIDTCCIGFEWPASFTHQHHRWARFPGQWIIMLVIMKLVYSKDIGQVDSFIHRIWARHHSGQTMSMYLGIVSLLVYKESSVILSMSKLLHFKVTAGRNLEILSYIPKLTNSHITKCSVVIMALSFTVLKIWGLKAEYI